MIVADFPGPPNYTNNPDHHDPYYLSNLGSILKVLVLLNNFILYSKKESTSFQKQI